MEAEKQEFDKAFEAAMSDEVVEDVKQVEETPPEAPVEKPTIIEEPVVAERVEVVPGYTQEELQESLAQIPKLKKALDTSYGTFGKKIAELDEIIAKHKSKAGDDQTEMNAKGVTLDALKQEYPDIAELLAKDLKGGNNSDDVLKVVETKLAEERTQRETEAIEASRKRLARVHPDFRDIALYTVEDGIVKFPDPKFGNWLANQPKDKFDTVTGSKDADDLSDILTEYKKSLVPPKKASLEAAILPKGNGLQGRALTDKEIEDAAFAAEMAN